MKIMEETNNRNLKEIQPIFTITMLDYFPHMSVFHQERTGFDHHWTRILCVYSAGAYPFDLVASFKFGNHKSNVKSVERRGIKIKKKYSSQRSLIDTPVRGKLKSVSEKKKSVILVHILPPKNPQKTSGMHKICYGTYLFTTPPRYIAGIYIYIYMSVCPLVRPS